jgi:hypothetical protein
VLAKNGIVVIIAKNTENVVAKMVEQDLEA